MSDSDEYNLMKPAFVIVFNQEKFPTGSGIENRTGSEQDVKRLKALFKNYNVKTIEVYKDTKLKDIKKIMKDCKYIFYVIEYNKKKYLPTLRAIKKATHEI